MHTTQIEPVQETGEVFCKYFEKVFNNIRPIDESVLEDISQRDVLHEHGSIPLPMEVKNAMTRMANRKAAGDNKIPLEAYKYLTGDNFDSFYSIIVDFWNDTHNPDEFHVAKLCILPKKGNLRLTKNYRGICLLDVASKVISVVIADRCQSVLKQHGIDEQNGFLKKKGCLDASFALKLALQTRKEFNLNTWVVFVDLVKAFDTVNRDMLMKILARFGLPEPLINVIRRLYKPVRMKFKSGKQIHEFLNLVGVKQGDNLAPVLFLFVMQAALESLERVWAEHSIILPSFNWLPNNEDGTSNGTLTGQRANQPGVSFEFFRSLYADDGAFMFTSREDMINGTSLLHTHLQRFGMLMHVGSRATETSEGSKSKTEAVFFPSRTTSTSIEEIQSNSADFDLVCDSGGFITFTNEFRYLGTIISSDLRDRPDIDRRINQASKAFGSLRSSVFCNEKQLSPIIRRRLFMAIVVNLLLWGCETWALLSEDRNRLNVCFNKWVRAMTGTKWSDIREKRITNKQLRERLDNIESFDEIYNHRCLNWFIKLAVMPATESENRLPRKLLGAWCPTGKRLRGGQLKNTRHSYLDLLNNLKFDESDPILGSNKGELSCIFALINDDNAEFNLRVDHGLHELVRDWLLDSTAPVFVNEC